MREFSSGHLLSIYTFYNVKWFCYRTAKALIRLRECAGWSGLDCPYMPEDRFSHGVADMFAIPLPAYVILNISTSQRCHSMTYRHLHTEKDFYKYSWLSLSRTRLSRITAYLEVNIWSLPKHENLTTGKKILWKRGKNAPQEQFLLFSTIFSIYL